MPEMHLRKNWFTYSAAGPFTKNKETTQKFIETTNSWYIYEKELKKACIQHDMVYEDLKNLYRRTFADKVLCDKAFNIASIVYKVFLKKPLGEVLKMKIFLIKN